MNTYFDTEFLEAGGDQPILLISIGMVREDGAEYYAEVDLPQAEWDRICAHDWLVVNVVPHLSGEVKPRSQIAEEIRTFVGRSPSFWAYCGAYDWVVLNQLYGTMVDPPHHWAYYCNDIAQYAAENNVNRRTQLPVQEGVAHNALEDAKWVRAAYDEITRVRISRVLALRSQETT